MNSVEIYLKNLTRDDREHKDLCLHLYRLINGKIKGRSTDIYIRKLYEVGKIESFKPIIWHTSVCSGISTLLRFLGKIETLNIGKHPYDNGIKFGKECGIFIENKRYVETYKINNYILYVLNELPEKCKCEEIIEFPNRLFGKSFPSFKDGDLAEYINNKAKENASDIIRKTLKPYIAFKREKKRREKAVINEIKLLPSGIFEGFVGGEIYRETKIKFEEKNIR